MKLTYKNFKKIITISTTSTILIGVVGGALMASSYPSFNQQNFLNSLDQKNIDTNLATLEPIKNAKDENDYTVDEKNDFDIMISVAEIILKTNPNTWQEDIKVLANKKTVNNKSITSIDAYNFLLKTKGNDAFKNNKEIEYIFKNINYVSASNESFFASVALLSTTAFLLVGLTTLILVNKYSWKLKKEE
ncbi:MAG: hypothetical protein ACRCRZ_01745 [Metamycoplasmataceae bacterium]